MRYFIAFYYTSDIHTIPVFDNAVVNSSEEIKVHAHIQELEANIKEQLQDSNLFDFNTESIRVKVINFIKIS